MCYVFFVNLGPTVPTEEKPEDKTSIQGQLISDISVV